MKRIKKLAVIIAACCAITATPCLPAGAVQEQVMAYDANGKTTVNTTAVLYTFQDYSNGKIIVFHINPVNGAKSYCVYIEFWDKYGTLRTKAVYTASTTGSTFISGCTGVYHAGNMRAVAYK